jgi:hypothetical protein
MRRIIIFCIVFWLTLSVGTRKVDIATDFAALWQSRGVSDTRFCCVRWRPDRLLITRSPEYAARNRE